ncbi:YCF48-related protein [Mucilaginibacter flavidus]|uniref:YCF48-related protein n=1 Tax=Mucilaginibacter flavidus TaxID=2949309 RepID=UPI002093DF82|nr:YCF48-related protein [Mucilaginibacter flavidus]MCO5948694.1 YCF48-related protein [Mucilaginibacter flavidus]
MFRKIVIISLIISLLTGFSASSQTLVKKFISIGASANLNGNVLFAADDGVHGIELWKTDGTGGGSAMVKDINPGRSASNVASLFAFNNKVYFSATDGIHGVELWQSDGTASGTIMIKDINPSLRAGSQPEAFFIFKGSLYFTASENDSSNNGIWKTDGTTAGTVKVYSNNAYISQLIIVGNYTYFSQNYKLWRTDGSQGNAHQINVDEYYRVDKLLNAGNKLYFVTSNDLNDNDPRVYVIDPVDNKPVLLHSFTSPMYGSSHVDDFTAAGSKLYFTGNQTVNFQTDKNQLWVSDGTAAGTVALKSFDQDHSTNYNFITFNNKLYFFDANEHKLWTSDGTEAGTVKVSEAISENSISPIISGGKMYFISSEQIWQFDGTNAQIAVQQPKSPKTIFDANGGLYFTVFDSIANTYDLWSSVSTPQISVSINHNAAPNGGNVDFTSQANSTVVELVAITNNGQKDLIFGDISVSGGSFYVNGQPSQTLAAGASANFNLIYSPGKEGQTAGTLVIKSNDNNGQNNFITNLKGTAAGNTTGDFLPPDGLFKSITFADNNPKFSLSNTSIDGSSALNTTVGTFNLNGGTSGYQFQLVSGAGSDDNKSFKIEAGSLKTASTFNFASQNTFSIRIKAVSATASVEKNFVIKLTNASFNPAAAVCTPTFNDLGNNIADAVYAGARIVAVTDAGKILTSDDNGNTWKIINTGTYTAAKFVKFPDPKTGYILGTNNNAMMKTDDGGNTWFSITSPAAAYPGLNNMYFHSANVGYTFGSTGIFKTLDGGKSWSKSAYNPTGELYSAWFLDENNGFICGAAHTLIHTTDGGNTWQNIPLDFLESTRRLTDITFVNATIGYIIDNHGELLETTNGGQSWNIASNIGIPVSFFRLYFVNTTTGYCFGGLSSQVIYKTTDGGLTWNNENIVVAGSAGGIAINKTGDKFCAVGSNNTIYLKSGSGPWTQRSNLAPQGTVDGNLFASGAGYVFAYQSLKTIDGGITWKDMNIPFYPDQVVAGQFITVDVGYYASGNNLFKTVNGGQTWVKSNTDSNNPIRRIYIFDSQEGFYYTDYDSFRTTDGGVTWEKISLPSMNGYRSAISFADASTGFTASGYLFKSNDRGTTWTKQTVGEGEYITVVNFANAQVGLAACANGLIFRTTDGGNTWTKILTQFSQPVSALKFANNNTAYLMIGGEFYQTKDGGITWQLIVQFTRTPSFFSVNDGVLFTSNYSIDLFAKFSDADSAPASAGYITGDTTVVASAKNTYSIPPIDNTYYRWTTSGAADIDYQNNTALISWKTAGKYTLKVTPYNGCADGGARTINIDVLAVPDPVVTGPDTVNEHAIDALYSTLVQPNTTYTWSGTNATSVTPLDNQVTVNWGDPGPGKITVTEVNSTLNIKKSATLNVAIIKGSFTLPENNFTVKINGVTCKGSNNGIITIKAQQALNYTVAVTGPSGFNKNYSFTDSLKVDNLVPGTYNACIGIKDSVNFQRCYTAEVTEPKDLALYSTINADNKTLTLNLSGADSYFIELNGNKYQTNNTQLNLPLADGANKLKVYSDRLCQGVIEKYINLNKITLFPDPFVDSFSINLGSSPETTVGVEIANALGRSLYKKQLVNNNGQISIDATGFDKGIYLLKLTLGQTSTVFKIAKK